MGFPATRPRRLRRTASIRRLVREHGVDPGKLIQPLFVVSGEGVSEPLESMPGQARRSIDVLIKAAREAHELGVGGVILFGIPERKDPLGSEGYSPDGVIARALRAVKAEVAGLPLIADVCCCEYTSHGHCGVVEDGEVVNDQTLELLARAAVVYADAGADVVAPSDMMDGRVGRIRAGLDQAGHGSVAILSYAVKYASAYYGPFRDAAGSAPSFGDRCSYQMDPANGREALREAELDLGEGADMLMVKPAGPCLDVLARLRDRFDVPLAAYQVSGEYAMIKAAAARGLVDEQRIVDESLVGIRRAGADVILTYFATEVARRRSEGS